MKVLLKSLKELEYEYGIKKRDSYLIIGGNIIPKCYGMIELFGKIVEAQYEEETDTYLINDCYFDPSLIKGEIVNEETKYTIKRLNDSIEYDLYVVK